MLCILIEVFYIFNKKLIISDFMNIFVTFHKVLCYDVFFRYF